MKINMKNNVNIKVKIIKVWYIKFSITVKLEKDSNIINVSFNLLPSCTMIGTSLINKQKA